MAVVDQVLQSMSVFPLGYTTREFSKNLLQSVRIGDLWPKTAHNIRDVKSRWIPLLDRHQLDNFSL